MITTDGRVGGFFDFVDAVQAEDSEGEVAECCQDLGAISGVDLLGVFPPDGVTDVVVCSLFPSVGERGCVHRLR